MRPPQAILSQPPMPPISAARLREAQDRFIAQWGQMGSAWGISRTVAEIFALLYITGEPLNADDVIDRLQISRGNASMSLRSLLDWGLITRVHKRGDRKEYFQAEQDPWIMARQIVRERFRREIQPVVASIYELRDLTDPSNHNPRAASPAQAESDVLPARAETNPTSDPSPKQNTEHNERLDALLELLNTTDKLVERFVGSEGKGLRLAATMLAKIP